MIKIKVLYRRKWGFFCFCLKFRLFLNIIVFTKTCLAWTGHSLGEGSLILHWQYMVYLRYTVLCWYENIAKWKNVLNMGYTSPKSFSNLAHFFWTSIPPSGDYSNQLSACSCALTTNFVGSSNYQLFCNALFLSKSICCTYRSWHFLHLKWRQTFKTWHNETHYA